MMDTTLFRAVLPQALVAMVAVKYPFEKKGPEIEDRNAHSKSICKKISLMGQTGAPQSILESARCRSASCALLLTSKVEVSSASNK